MASEETTHSFWKDATVAPVRIPAAVPMTSEEVTYAFWAPEPGRPTAVKPSETPSPRAAPSENASHSFCKIAQTSIDQLASTSSTSSTSAELPIRSAPQHAEVEATKTVSDTFFAHSTAPRVNTDAVIAQALQKQHPTLSLITVPTSSLGGVVLAGAGSLPSMVDLLGYAAAGHASTKRLADSPADERVLKVYAAPARRLDNEPGGVRDDVIFGKFSYVWGADEFLLYVVDGRDGTQSYPQVQNNYLLAKDSKRAEALVLAAGKWSGELHGEIWVFDRYWTKSKELYKSIEKASWDSVILDPAMKRQLISDHLSFFESRGNYERYGVPWKRGLIYHGPPGNGKTISIKAMANTLYGLADPVPMLYVRSLQTFSGPEVGIGHIFAKARQFAPCYLVLEDLDSLVSVAARSYFLNELDGLKSNDGIFIVGSTNHLELLDPGIAKRPSRFDRKYFFPDPDLGQRAMYCRYWQRKLSGNRDVSFPDKLVNAIAEITDGFSFAYIQEAFVAALLVIARQDKGEDTVSEDMVRAVLLQKDVDEEEADGWVGVRKAVEDPELDGLVLWVEIRKQIRILREGMEEEMVAVKGKGRG